MATSIASPSDSLGFLPWLREFLTSELAPYPGRGWTVARMVIAATATMILIMTFRIPGGALGTLYAFLVTRDNLHSTLKAGISIVGSYSIMVCFVLLGAGLFADRPSARFLWFAGCMFVLFFALRVVQDYGVYAGFALMLCTTLPIWQIPNTAENRVELTLWQALAVGLGTLVTIGVEAIFHAFRPQDDLFQGLDARLAVLQQLIESYDRNEPVSGDIANRLAQYSVVGVSSLRRILGRARYERLYRDQLTAVVALTGRFIDLAASSAQSPHQLLEGDRDRLKRLANQIATIRESLAAFKVPQLHPEPINEPSGIPLLPEMERNAALIPQVFLGSESIEAYFPSNLDQEENAGGFFRNDAFHNPEYIHFALRGCLAATTCYFTYEILDWRGLSSSVTTCAVTALSNVGTSRQKQLLRIAGVVAGGFIFGLGAQVFILPNIDSITAFGLLIAAVTAVAAWFATSSQRLSYFGIQLAFAFYQINLQEFSMQTSLTVARDRVVGVLLGLLAMWLVFDSLGTVSAAEHMVESFVANLRAIADLALQPGKEAPDLALKRIRALRSEIGANFQTVVAQADAIPLEFGLNRQQGMADRALIRGWQPQLRTIYLMELALLQHRRYGADADLSPDFLAAQTRFNEGCALVLMQMADSLNGKPAASTADLNALLHDLSHALVRACSDHPVRALGVERVSQHMRDELLELSQKICRARLVRSST